MLGNGICEAECASSACHYDSGDCVRADNPVPVYVSPGKIGLAVGSEAEPLDSIQTALEQVWAPFTTIYLMKGTHTLELAGGSQSLVIATTVKLAPLLCSHSQNSLCCQGSALIQLTREDLTWVVTGSLTIENVEFIGNFPLKPSCTLNQCLYCPAIQVIDGKPTSDRGDIVQDYAEQSICDLYKDSVLIQVSPAGQLLLNSVSFRLIKHQLLSLISSECGVVTLTDVTFSAIVPRRNGIMSAVITHKGRRDQPQALCGSLNYTHGLVELINDGYEYNSGSPFSGFLSANLANSVLFSDVKFRLNNVLGKWTAVTALIYINTSALIEIRECTFESTLTNGATVMVTADRANTIAITLDRSNFTSNYGIEIIHVTVTALTMQTNITNCVFQENISQDTVIGVYGEVGLQGAAKVTINDLSAVQNLARNFLSVNTSAVLYLRKSNFTGNGDIPDLMSRILDIYISSSRSYMLVTPTVNWPVCIGTILLKDVLDYALELVLIAHSNCAFGSPGLTHIGSPHSVFPT